MTSIIRAFKTLVNRTSHDVEPNHPKPCTPVKQKKSGFQHVSTTNTSSPPRFDTDRKLPFTKRITRKFYKKNKDESKSAPMKIHDDDLQIAETPHFNKIVTVAPNSPGASPQHIRVRALLSPNFTERPKKRSPLARVVSRRLSSFFSSQENKCAVDIVKPILEKASKSFVLAEGDVDLTHDQTYNVTFSQFNKLLTLNESNKIILQSPIHEHAQKSRQEWCYTEDGYIQSNMDKSMVLEIRNSVVQCNKRAPPRSDDDILENDDIVSQHFEVLFTDPNKSTSDKFITLKMNRKMMLGMSKRVESKIVLHVLNADNSKTQQWVFRKSCKI